MAEYEDCATVKFGRELTEEERKDFEGYVDCFRMSDVDWYKERIDD